MRFEYITGLVIGCLMLFVVAGNCELCAQSAVKSKDQLKMTARYHVEAGKDTGFLIVKMEIPKGNHIYSLTQKKPLSPSKISVKPMKQIAFGKTFQADQKPKVIEKDPIFETRVEKHNGTVQFYVPIRVDTSADLKLLKPEIVFSGQMCSDEGFCQLINNKMIKAEYGGVFEREAKAAPATQRK